MNSNAESAKDDFAFMRALVQGGDTNQRQFGQGYFAAGLIYGAQLIGHWAQATGALVLSQSGSLALGFGPSVLYLVVLAVIILRGRRAAVGAGVVPRAVGAIFGCVGLANLALIGVIGSYAWRIHSLDVWLLYPCVVFVLQGAAWFVTAALRRRLWQSIVGIGWFIAGVAMSTAIGNPALYCLICGVSIFAFMAIPGAVLTWPAKKAA